ncbi:hypothetical protein L2E82_47739 [Cichorium intybus]|uniref:Uncharacterized protein n=1 Tax=Cichorium intybus TaxID=13427 RepID=A0ACB8YWW0_CICIN|nr:hypothetical protein L2E82_47739 [Cichorium intybus]
MTGFFFMSKTVVNFVAFVLSPLALWYLITCYRDFVGYMFGCYYTFAHDFGFFVVILHHPKHKKVFKLGFRMGD